MAITNGYLTLEEFQNQFVTNQGYDPDETAEYRLERIIQAASRLIDKITNRRFFVTSETRYYTARDYDKLLVHDFTGITALKTDDNDDATFENTWTTSDYHQMPLNAALDSEPYTWLEITNYGSYTFPLNTKGISLQATFGYAATAPDEIREATMLAAGQIWKRKDAIFGVAGTNGLGLLQVIQGQLERDAHFMTLVEPFIRWVGN